MARRNTPPERHERQKARADAERQRSALPPQARRPDAVWVFGIHAASAALANPRREIRRILATRNALARLTDAGIVPSMAAEDVTPRDLDRLLGADAVHQGIAIESAPLTPLSLADAAQEHLIVVLDQITDPHNVGAILRSAVAFGAGAVVTTSRHTPNESGVLAKAASGALDQIKWIEVQNLSRALAELGSMGFKRIGLESDAETEIEATAGGERIALVMGAEGKGLRRLTRDSCDVVARLALPGAIQSLNVSNAAALALYVVSRGRPKA